MMRSKTVHINSQETIKPKQAIQLFNIEHELTKHRNWHQHFSDNIIITPDEKTILASQPQRVYSLSLLSFDARPEVIIEHPYAKYSPMLCLAEKEDNSILIASTVNYIDEETNSVVSACVLHTNNIQTTKKFPFLTQAIDMNKCGTKLAIASDYAVGLLTIRETQTSNENYAYFSEQANDSYITDIAISEDGTYIVAAGTGGIIKLFYALPDAIYKVKSIRCGDNIERVHFPIFQQEYGEILYKTNNGTIKSIDMHALLNSDNERFDATPLFQPPALEQATMDSGWNIGSTHWTQRSHNSKETRKRIIVYKKKRDPEQKQRIILEATGLGKNFSFLSETGTKICKPSHFIATAIRGNRVVALGTNGYVYSWIIPENNDLPQQVIDEEQNTNRINLRNKKNMHRSSSASYTNATNNQ